MKTLRVIECAGLIGLLLGACSWSVRTPSVQTQKNGENAEITQSPAVVESEQSNKTSIQEELYQTVAIANLADENYQFCTKPPSYKAPSGLDVRGWCFVFRKTGARVVGIYGYWAPKDSARICVSGTAKGNTVSGSAYEIVEGGSEPITITPEDITRLSRGNVWNDGSEEGDYLRVSIPHLYSTGKYPSSGYYAWMHYDNVQLDLSRFYQRDIGRLIPPEKCPN